MESDPLDLSPERIHQELMKYEPTVRNRLIEKLILAALGSIPWVGSFLSTMATLKTDEPRLKTDSLHTKWLKEHEVKLGRLFEIFADIDARLTSFGARIEERIDSEQYLDLVRKAFRVWDDADTDEKRKYVGNLVANAAGTQLCADDVIRLFIDWLRMYHEMHFAVIGKIYNEPGITRHDIWQELKGVFPREDSAEADLYKYLMRELSTGGVIRQARQTTVDGDFLKRKRPPRAQSSSLMKSAFDDAEQYVLTELGKQFVHYTMTDLVKRIDTDPAAST